MKEQCQHILVSHGSNINSAMVKRYMIHTKYASSNIYMQNVERDKIKTKHSFAKSLDECQYRYIPQ